jgi:hypothetical protein
MDAMLSGAMIFIIQSIRFLQVKREDIISITGLYRIWFLQLKTVLFFPVIILNTGKKVTEDSAAGQPASQFVVCLQNHDQVGNRAYGKRLTNLISFEGLKSAAGILLLSPYIPLLFMGEEYGEMNPFQYFISHEDENLVKQFRPEEKMNLILFSGKMIFLIRSALILLKDQN